MMVSYHYHLYMETSVSTFGFLFLWNPQLLLLSILNFLPYRYWLSLFEINAKCVPTIYLISNLPFFQCHNYRKDISNTFLHKIWYFLFENKTGARSADLAPYKLESYKKLSVTGWWLLHRPKKNYPRRLRLPFPLTRCPQPPVYARHGSRHLWPSCRLHGSGFREWSAHAHCWWVRRLLPFLLPRRYCSSQPWSRMSLCRRVSPSSPVPYSRPSR